MLELYRDHGVERPFERVKEAFYRADDAAYGDRRVADMSLAEMMDFHVGVQLAGSASTIRACAADSPTRSSSARGARWPTSRAVLARLAPRHRLGVVSNFYGNVGRILADAAIAPLLTVVADSTCVGCMKPDRRIFEHALAALGTAPDTTLHVGDSYERDVRAAHALGLRTAWLVRPHTDPRRRIPTADLRISLDSTGLSTTPLRSAERAGAMKAGLIAAGLGERLRAAGITMPKPLVEVAGKPLIDHVLDAVAAAGIDDVACIFNEEADDVEAHCRRRRGAPRLQIVRRTTPSSMESLFTLAPHLSDAPFLLLTVDAVFAPAVLRDFLAAAARHADADVVLAMTDFVDDEKPLRLAVDDGGRVTALGDAAAGSPLVTAGFYVFHPRVFAEIAAARAARLTALRQYLRPPARRAATASTACAPARPSTSTARRTSPPPTRSCAAASPRDARLPRHRPRARLLARQGGRRSRHPRRRRGAARRHAPRRACSTPTSRCRRPRRPASSSRCARAPPRSPRCGAGKRAGVRVDQLVGRHRQHRIGAACSPPSNAIASPHPAEPPAAHRPARRRCPSGSTPAPGSSAATCTPPSRTTSCASTARAAARAALAAMHAARHRHARSCSATSTATCSSSTPCAAASSRRSRRRRDVAGARGGRGDGACATLAEAGAAALELEVFGGDCVRDCQQQLMVD